MKLKSGIYSITNIANGKIYVGSSLFLSKRIMQHKSDLKQKRHKNSRLQNAWNKYGADAFAFNVIEHVEGKESLIAREQFWIDFHMSASRRGYNINPCAYSNYGVIPSAETRSKMALAQIGRKHTKETLEKISAAHTGRKYGIETRQRMSDARRNITQETRNKMSEYAKNRSAEHKEKMSAALSARTPSEKVLEILLVAAKKPKSAETKARMSDAAKLRWSKQQNSIKTVRA